MTRRMADSANISYIDPGTVDLIGYYIDGKYVPSSAQLAKFAGKIHVPIAVNPKTNAGLVFDGPPDNATWNEVVDWVVMRRKAGAVVSVYTDQSDWTKAIAAFNARNVAQPYWWIAAWNNRAEMISGAIAHQYQTVTNRYDLSVVADHWPGIDPASTAPKPPAPPVTVTPTPPAPAVTDDSPEDEMIILSAPHTDGSTAHDLYLLSGSLLSHITDVASASALQNAGIKTASISFADFTQLKADAAALQGKLSGSLNISGQLNAS